MLRSLATLSLAAGIFCYAQASTPTARGVEVTPPDEDLGDREQYVGWIGVDTDYLSMEGTKTRVSIRHLISSLIMAQNLICISGLESIRSILLRNLPPSQ